MKKTSVGVFATITGATLLASLLTVSPARAGVYTWTGSKNANWANKSNWSPLGPPGAGDEADFTGTAATANPPNINNNSVGLFHVLSALTASFTMTTTSGDTLTIYWYSPVSGGSNGIQIDQSGFTTTITSGGTLVLANPQFWTNDNTTASTYSLTVLDAVNNSGNMLTLTGSGNTKIGGKIWAPAV